MFTRATLTARERMVKRSIPCIDAEAPCGPEKQKARNLWGAGLIPQEGREETGIFSRSVVTPDC
jgi:hypothetical protein